MKRFLILFSALILLLALFGVANATTMAYTTYTTDGNNYTSPYSGVTVITFDGALPSGVGMSGTGSLVTGSSSGAYYAPMGVTQVDTTQYLAVTGGKSETITLPTGNYNYFGLWWGSEDTWNTISFYKGTTLVYTGIPGSNVSKGTSDLYVNFLGLPNFDNVVLASAYPTFESDNLAFGTNPTLDPPGAIPEPATILLLGLGLIGLAGAKRKFKK